LSYKLTYFITLVGGYNYSSMVISMTCVIDMRVDVTWLWEHSVGRFGGITVYWTTWSRCVFRWWPIRSADLGCRWAFCLCLLAILVNCACAIMNNYCVCVRLSCVLSPRVRVRVNDRDTLARKQ